MGRLIIDGNSVFEIDEDCLKRRKPVKNCDIDKYVAKEEKEYLQIIKKDVIKNCR